LTLSNIMAAGDQVKISSDGLLRIGESSGDLWAPNPNGPPEARSGITPAGDVWLLGMTLVEALTQQAPAWESTAPNDPMVPESLEAPFLDIARRCLRSDPRLRCSLGDIAHALRPPSLSPLEHPGASEAIAITPPAAPETARKRQYLLPVAAGAVLVGAVLTGAILTRGTSGSSARTEAPRPAPTEPVTVQAKSAPAPVTAPGGEGGPHASDQASGTPTPVPKPVVPAAGPDNPVEQTDAAGVEARVMPDVPPQILRTIRGTVRVSVRVRVDRSGAVVDAALDSRSGSKYFGRVAEDAARRWKFKPASDPASGAETARLLRFQFRPSGCRVSVSQVKP